MDDYTGSGMSHDEAVRYILAMLTNPLAMMSLPMREKAEQMASEHEITAMELLNAARRQAQNT